MTRSTLRVPGFVMRKATSLICVVLAIGSAMFWAARATAQQTDADVIATERAALERYGKGDPDGFLSTYAPDVTYFDPTTERRVDGLPAMTALLAPMRGKLRIDRFEMLNPKVQRHGEIAVLSYNIVNYQKQADGPERVARRWNSTAVFRRLDGRWRTIHSHWSYTMPDVK
jgi:ketosteroid isomerase-like protein